MEQDGGMRKQVEFDDQHKGVTVSSDDEQKQSGSISSSFSSSDCLEDDLIVIEDEFDRKSPWQSKQPDEKMLTDYDSSRIPSGIFSSRPSAADWSVASNESLFSLHMGGNNNSSFSKDQAFLMYKSGELGRVDEHSSPHSHSALPSLTEVDVEMDNLAVKDDITKTASSPQGDDDALGNKSSVEDCRNSPHSDCSNHSFAFPVFSDDLGRNKTVKLEENPYKSPKKRQQQGGKEELFQQQSPRKPHKASYYYFGRRSWFPRCSCFSLPCKQSH